MFYNDWWYEFPCCDFTNSYFSWDFFLRWRKYNAELLIKLAKVKKKQGLTSNNNHIQVLSFLMLKILKGLILYHVQLFFCFVLFFLLFCFFFFFVHRNVFRYTLVFEPNHQHHQTKCYNKQSLAVHVYIKHIRELQCKILFTR